MKQHIMNIFNTIVFFLLFLTINGQQGFYEMETVQTIELTFAESNWDQLLDIAYTNDAGYIQAESITINGVAYGSVGVKYKGNSSYNSNQVKNPWHIELDTYVDQDYDGYTDIKLANGHKDPSFLRDVLGYQVLRQYMEAPQANYANLYVNGQLIGLYTNTESISKNFMNSRFGSKDNTRFKCSPPDGASPQSSELPNLEYLGQDSTDYYDAYELKSETGWQELIDLCDTIVNHKENIGEILDVDRALWMLAFNNVIVNLDSYSGNFAQNYYLYRSDYGQFLPISWDLNESFGVFSLTGTSNLNGTTAKQQMTHLLHQSDDEYPLIKELLSIPTYKRMYLAHMKTILLENFDNRTYYDIGVALQSTIEGSVIADNHKFFTYNNFADNLTRDVSVNGGGPQGNTTVPGLTNLMDARAAYLLGLGDLSNVEPSISNISLSNVDPFVKETVTLTVKVNDADNVFLGYRNSEITAPFTKIQMFDDGSHGDGEANDGIYGIEYTISDINTEYFIYAENADIGMFSPRRAEYEYHTIEASLQLLSNGVVINEFMASNDVTAMDQDGEFDDWIELYNNSSEIVDLSGYYLSDDLDNLTQWAFPAGTLIEGNGYLIIWADEDTEQVGLHADFKLSRSGETFVLVDSDGTTVLDGLDYPELDTDSSYGRYPNGTGHFQVMSTVTFNEQNAVTSHTNDLTDNNHGLKIYPNPVSSDVYLERARESSNTENQVMITSVTGLVVYQGELLDRIQVSTIGWMPGIYVVRSGEAVMKFVVE